MLDTCGTGGDGSRPFNISTIASFIVAGAGAPVAKHGNRAMSSRSGSHDVIEALGLDSAPSPELAVRCLREAKLAFLFAPAHHASTRHVIGPRRELGLRTLFNMLGPLTNPCGARFHMNGIFSRQRCEPMARAHALLGSERAFIVHGEGNLDEIAPAGRPTSRSCATARCGRTRSRPATSGSARSTRPACSAASAAFNAKIVIETLGGGPHKAVRNASLMAAGAALYVSGNAPDLRTGTERAAAALDSGAARDVLERLRAITPLPAKKS